MQARFTLSFGLASLFLGLGRFLFANNKLGNAAAAADISMALLRNDRLLKSFLLSVIYIFF
jgi:hypothetical protein